MKFDTVNGSSLLVILMLFGIPFKVLATDELFSEKADLVDWQVHLVRNISRAKELAVKKCGGLAICEIDGNPFFYGVSIQPPRSVLTSLIVTNDDNSIQLDVSDIYSRRILPREKPERFFKIKCVTDQSCVVRAVFGDAGNAYGVEWRIKGGVSARTIVADMTNQAVMKRIYESVAGRK